MAYTPTGAFEIVKKIQDVDETTYGSTPGSPTFVLSAHDALLRENTEIRANFYRELGNRDIYKALKYGELHSFELRWQPHATRLIRWFTELPNGAGTPDTSKSFTYTQKVNAVESWFRYLGAIPDQLEIEVTEAEVACVGNILCQDIPAEVTADPFTTPNYAGADTSDVWTGAHNGTDPLDIAGAKYDTPRFKTTFNWSPERIKPNGSVKAKYIRVTNRDIKVEFDTWKKSGVLRADLISFTPRALTYTLNSTGPKNISLTDLYLERLQKQSDARATAHQLETFAGTAKSGTVTA